ncbi:MAG: MGMT family protein [Propionibacteriales bacterium]|nr:MGMT family protein [Propionibacteriales bacterium]
MGTMNDTADSILLAAAAIPPGQVASYGDLGRVVGCGPRLVARVLSTSGGGTCWWRVVRADGTIAAPLVAEATRLLADEGVVVVDGRIDLAKYRAEQD